VSGAILGQTTFAVLGLLFLLTAIRTFTSTIYMSLFGQVSNDTVGAIALAVFGASVFAIVPAWRAGPRGAIGFSAALLAAATVAAAISRNAWADVVLSGAAVVSGAWWLALAQSARIHAGDSPFVLGLPLALAADLALRAGMRTVPVVDLAPALTIALAAAAVLVFVASGLAAFAAEREWTSPGPRGAVAVLAVPPLLLVWETAAGDPGQVAGSAGLGLGPEGPGTWYAVALGLGIGLTSGAIALTASVPRVRLVAVAALAIGAALVWGQVPLAAAVGGALMAVATLISTVVLPDTAARPARSPLTTVLALTLGWVLFVALAFAFYAYYGPPHPPLLAAGVVALGVFAGAALPRLRLGAGAVVLVGILALVVPMVALLTTPAPAAFDPRGPFRLMTYNIHQGYGEGNVPSLAEIAEVIRAEQPDVIVLQEVPRGWMIAAQHDALTYLAEQLRMSYVFEPTIGEAFGNAVLSRLPVSDVSYVSFERQPGLLHQPRGAVLVSVAGVRVVATHLDQYEDAGAVREGQVRTLLRAWGGARPAVIAGDLNARPGSAELGLIAEAGFRDLVADAGADQPTFPASAPDRRIDHIWGIGVTGTQAHTVPSTASDHRAVVINVSRLD